MYAETQQWWRQAWALLRYTIAHFLKDGCRQRAAALTYTTLFAVVPVMTVTFSILSVIPSMQQVGGNIQDFLFRHFIPNAGTSVGDYLHDFSAQASHLTVVGIAILFVTSLLMIVNVEEAFNHIWRVRDPRQGVLTFLRYWAVLSLGPLLLGMGFLMTSYMASIEILNRTASFVSNIVPGFGLVPLLFSALGFTLIYIAVPNCKVPPRAGLYGGISAAILFEAAKRGFTIFITHFSSYKLIYGAFAAFPIFLLWVYLSWLITLFGVELTRALVVYRGEPKGHRHPVLTMLDVLQLFYRHYQKGEVVSDIAAIAVLGREDTEVWAEFSRLILEQRIIQKTEEGDYVLCRNLDHLDFWEFYRKLPWPLPQVHELATLRMEDQWADLLRPALERAQHQLEQELRIPLGHILATERAVIIDPSVVGPDARA